LLIDISRPDALTSIKVLPLGWEVERRRSGKHQKARPDPQAPMTPRPRKTDWLIDQIVYKLYDLTEEEIKIVEGQGVMGSLS
jgi:hypothetical protein